MMLVLWKQRLRNDSMAGETRNGRQAHRAGVVPAASAILFREGRVLLVQRANGTYAGLWSAPGGKIETGETALAAALREVREETGLEAFDLRPLAEHEFDVPPGPDHAGVRYRIEVLHGIAGPGRPVAGSDAGAVSLVSPEKLAEMPLTPGLAKLIAAAQAARSA